MPQSQPRLDRNGATLTSSGATVVKNITAATVIKASQGRIVRVVVLVAGTTVGTINDLAVTTGAAVANQIGIIPDVVGPYVIDMPCANGILIVPGTGQTVVASFN